MNHLNRYPGLNPFSTYQKHLFFGRERETSELFNLISVEKTVLLFAKSGIGKTSLLNAGVVPRLLENGIVPISVRFGTNAYKPEQHTSIALDEAHQRFNGILQPKGFDTSSTESLWQQLKRQVFEKDGKKYIPLFIFDQFEELFTLYTESEESRHFIRDLADLIRERLPVAQRDALLNGLNHNTLTSEEVEEAERIPNVKFVFSIRSDMLHFMDELTEEIPYILRNRYQLFGLSEEQAREAIVKPAALAKNGFVTAPFGYSEAALSEILTKLSKNHEVESFQIQLVCQALEEKLTKSQNHNFFPAENVAGNAHDLPLITPDFYGGPEGLEEIIEATYRNRLEELDEHEYEPARELLEVALINENDRRRSVDVIDLLNRSGVTQNLLDRLEAKRLIRKEPRLDSYYYEISHDTLLGPIGKFKKLRLEEETRKELKEQAAKQEIERQKIKSRKRKIMFAGSGATLLVGISLVMTFVALNTRKNLIQAETRAVRFCLTEANLRINELNYDSAYTILTNADSLRRETAAVGNALLELAFWYAETGDLDKAWSVLERSRKLLDKKLDKGLGDRRAARMAIEKLNPERFMAFEARYYPKMIPILGGVDTIGGMGDSIPYFPISVSDFHMAETETTLWQYGMFLISTKQTLPDGIHYSGGAKPITNVAWDDAVEYTNWLGKQKGMEPITVTGEDSNRTIVKGKKGYRLPTESEWEYAARAGTDSTHAGCNLKSLREFAWYNANAGGFSHPVKEKKPNGWGLYDMSGNVFEWCWDWYGAYPGQLKNNYSGKQEGDLRVRRGGAWGYNGTVNECQVAFRSGRPLKKSYGNTGFRVVLVGGK